MKTHRKKIERLRIEPHWGASFLNTRGLEGGTENFWENPVLGKDWCRKEKKRRRILALMLHLFSCREEPGEGREEKKRPRLKKTTATPKEACRGTVAALFGTTG